MYPRRHHGRERQSCKIEGWRTAKTCSYWRKTNSVEHAVWIYWDWVKTSVGLLPVLWVRTESPHARWNSKIVRVKLPKVEVRKFSRKLEDWQSSGIPSNLRGLPPEPARSVIVGFASSSSANYEAAFELLKKAIQKKDRDPGKAIKVFNKSGETAWPLWLVEAKYKDLPHTSR